jgi:hypothetical protein
MASPAPSKKVPIAWMRQLSTHDLVNLEQITREKQYKYCALKSAKLHSSEFLSNVGENMIFSEHFAPLVVSKLVLQNSNQHSFLQLNSRRCLVYVLTCPMPSAQPSS